MNKIFTAISSLLIVMGIKGQIPVKKETSSIPTSHADTISPKKVFPKVESKMAKDSKVYPKVEHKEAQLKVITGKDHKDSPNGTVIPKVESKIEHKTVQSKIVTGKDHKDSPNGTVIPKVEHKIDHKDASKTVIPKVEHKFNNQ